MSLEQSPLTDRERARRARMGGSDPVVRAVVAKMHATEPDPWEQQEEGEL